MIPSVFKRYRILEKPTFHRKNVDFLPNETVKHRQRHVDQIVTADLLEDDITAENVNDIFYTKGPSIKLDLFQSSKKSYVSYVS